jgi:hypothetical protein
MMSACTEVTQKWGKLSQKAVYSFLEIADFCKILETETEKFMVFITDDIDEWNLEIMLSGKCLFCNIKYNFLQLL